MGTFPDNIKEQIISCQNNYCGEDGCYNQIHSIHHKLHNTVVNNKNYPYFIQSPMNGIGLCLDCHTNKEHKHKISPIQAKIYNDYIEAWHKYGVHDIKRLLKNKELNAL